MLAYCMLLMATRSWIHISPINSSKIRKKIYSPETGYGQTFDFKSSTSFQRRGNDEYDSYTASSGVMAIWRIVSYWTCDDKAITRGIIFSDFIWFARAMVGPSLIISELMTMITIMKVPVVRFLESVENESRTWFQTVFQVRCVTVTGVHGVYRSPDVLQ